VSEGPFGRRSEPVDESPPPAEAPLPAPAPPAPPRGISSITWILGVLVVLALAYITLNSVRTEGPGSRGVLEGRVLPPFAAPQVDGPDGDAQVDPDKACSVQGPRILNSCALRESNQPVVLAFLATRSEQCERQVDRVDRVARRMSGVQFAAVAIRGSRASLASLKSRWTIPLAHDRDGAVSNLFAVAVCPTITFAKPGGIVEHTSLGLIDEAEIERRIAALR
jgi:hypothetical protein